MSFCSRRVIEEHKDSKEEHQHRDDQNLKDGTVVGDHVNLCTVMQDRSIAGVGAWHNGQQGIGQHWVSAPLLLVVLRTRNAIPQDIDGVANA